MNELIPIGQLAAFRVYPARPSRRHFRVRIFDSVVSLHRYVRATPRPRQVSRACRALTSRWPQAPLEIGEMVFARRWLAVDILSHECTHAALAWARGVRASPDLLTDEERLCSAQDALLGQIADHLWRHGLIHV